MRNIGTLIIDYGSNTHYKETYNMLDKLYGKGQWRIVAVKSQINRGIAAEFTFHTQVFDALQKANAVDDFFNRDVKKVVFLGAYVNLSPYVMALHSGLFHILPDVGQFVAKEHDKTHLVLSHVINTNELRANARAYRSTRNVDKFVKQMQLFELNQEVVNVYKNDKIVALLPNDKVVYVSRNSIPHFKIYEFEGKSNKRLIASRVPLFKYDKPSGLIVCINGNYAPQIVQLPLVPNDYFIPFEIVVKLVSTAY